MTTSAHLRVSDQERNEAIATIQAAYADGRLDESNLERRLDLAFGARTRLELGQSLEGLVRPRPQSPFSVPTMPVIHPGFASSAIRHTRAAEGPAAGLTHLSALPFGPFGPGAVWLFSSQGSPVRRQAAKALNFQVISAVVFIALSIVTGIFGGLGFIAGLWGFAWFVLTVVSGVKAWKGEDWDNPVTVIVDKRLVDEGRQLR